MTESDASSRHDLVLAVIPLALALGAVTAVAFSRSLVFGFAGGSVPATGTVGYALFVDPPEDTARGSAGRETRRTR